MAPFVLHENASNLKVPARKASSRFLKGKMDANAIRTALKTLPTRSKAYNKTYNAAMERIKGQTDSKELAIQVLSWITCTKRPLTTLELQHALAVEVGKLELDKDYLLEIEDMVGISSSATSWAAMRLKMSWSIRCTRFDGF